MIRPLGQRIVVRRLSVDEIRGIKIPDMNKKTSLVGQIIHRGPEADWVAVGDIVHYGRFSGTEVKKDGAYVDDEYEDCLYMNCEDLLGVIEPKLVEPAATQPQEVATVNG